MTQTGMTLKQFAASRFYKALDVYAEALRSGRADLIVRASVAVWAARRNETDRRMISRVFRQGRV